MATTKAGFGLVETTPLVGTPLSGQIRVKYASGVNDPLFARVLALADDASSCLIVSCDLSKIDAEGLSAIRSAVSERLPVAPQNIWVLTTHTHTGPAASASFETPRADEYVERLPGLIALAADTAWRDMAEARVSFTRKHVDDVGFVRRYRMVDGSVRTNPGVGNPDLVGPYRHARTELSILQFERDSSRLPIVIASFPCHADVVGGTEISADYPGRACKEMTQGLPGHPETLFLTGACGDINHIDAEGDSRPGGYGHAQAMGRRLAEEALSMWHMRSDISGGLDLRRTTVVVPRRAVAPELVSEARTLQMRSQHGGKDLSNEDVWTRELALLADMPEQIELEIAALVIGDMALVATPGEPFSALAEQIQNDSPFGNTVVAELAHAGPGYILPAECYDQDGYEERPARTSPFAPGAGEELVRATLRMLNE